MLHAFASASVDLGAAALGSTANLDAAATAALALMLGSPRGKHDNISSGHVDARRVLAFLQAYQRHPRVRGVSGGGEHPVLRGSASGVAQLLLAAVLTQATPAGADAVCALCIWDQAAHAVLNRLRIESSSCLQAY